MNNLKREGEQTPRGRRDAAGDALRLSPRGVRARNVLASHPGSKRAGLKSNDGAALLVAVAIFFVLLALGLTFYLTTRYEWRTASSVVAAQRADLAANAGVSVAMAFLARDAAAHATYTSVDHAWRSYFSGAAFAGKPWALPEGPLEEGGVPRVSLVAQPVVEDINVDPVTGQFRIPRQRQYEGRETGEWLYIPRFIPSGINAFASIPLESTFLLTTPWLISNDPEPTLPTAAQIVDTFADVDNNEDGFRDSIWIPLPRERYFGRVDFNGDGVVDQLGDGLDNDLDGETDEGGEVAVFIYYGGNDGLDNDGDGFIDGADTFGPDENRVFVTAPIADPANPGNYITFTNITQRDPQTLAVTSTFSLSTDPASGNVDRLDNDHNFVEGEHDEHILANIDYNPVTPDPRITDELGKAYNLIYAAYLDGTPYGIALNLPTPGIGSNGLPFQASVFTATGEPVCEIVGRFAVLINDEASKVNMNAAGGHTFVEEDLFDRITPATGYNPLTSAVRSLNQGVSPLEYDLRHLPDLDSDRAQNFWHLLTGYPQAPVLDPLEPLFGDFFFDAIRPGYGFIDDNGNALSLSINGIDDDGDALYYESVFSGDGVDNDLDGVIDEPGEGYQMGVDEGLRAYDTNGDGTPDLLPELEGVDEPGEYRPFQPYRNLVAELTGLDNDLDGVPDELGEIGDMVLRTREQLQLASDIGAARASFLRPLVTLHSGDKGDARVERTAALNEFAGIVGSYDLPSGRRALSGVKLDYNLASAAQIASDLKTNWGYAPTLAVGSEEANFARGLRLEGITVANALAMPDFNPDLGIEEFPADEELKALQVAASIKDHRDTDHARTSLTTTIFDNWWTNLGLPAREIAYTQAGIESIRINELMVRPVRRVEAEVEFGVGIRDPNVLTRLDTLGNRFNPAMQLGLHPNSTYPGSQWRTPQSSSTIVDSLGEKTCLLTSQSYMGGDEVNGNPDIAQFMFAASVDLPPGRYYLVASTVDHLGNITVEDPDDLEFRFKYVSLNGPAGPFLGATGLRNVGQTTILNDRLSLGAGSANESDMNWQRVVIGRNGPNLDLDQTGMIFLGEDLVPAPIGIADPAGYGQFEDNVIEIPPILDTTNPIFLCVAVRRGGDPLRPEEVALNFFEFSQEPDHEWVEVTNIAERDPTKSIFEQSINIAGWQLEVNRPSGAGITGRKLFTVPGSTTVKAQGTLIPPGGSLLLSFNKFDDALNPVGRQNHTVYGNGIGLARGDIPTTAGTTSFYNAITVPQVFPSNNPLSFQTGSVFAPFSFYADFIDRDGDGNINGDLIRPDDLIQSTQDPIGSEGPAKAWDRIVELIAPDIDAIGTDADRLARVVMGGGMLPNYPEQDGVDNDGDDLLLRNDFVDNDGDGIVDEIQGDPDDPDGRNEGVDEGRWTAISAPGTYGRQSPKPGSYSTYDSLGNLVTTPTHYVTATAANVGIPGVPGDSLTAFYLGDATTFAPDQKAFNELRWYPGDNVVITLYEGDASQNRIADQVTYTERDVVNRFIDDSQDVIGLRDPFHNTFTSFWPENTMGVDFYWSLQRKHPLYHGDLHGVTNRWQATDGAYDDWDRTRRFSDLQAITPLARNASYSRWNEDLRVAMGLTALPPFIFATNAGWAFVRGDGFDDDFLNFLTLNPSLTVTAGEGYGWVRNREFVSPGDAITVPHFHMRKTYNASIYPAIEVAQEFVLGQFSARDVAAAGDTTSMSPLNLTAGQATYRPLPTAVANPQTVLDQQNPDLFDTLPDVWAPVFLHHLPNDENVPMQYSLNFLLAPRALPVPLNSLIQRSVLQQFWNTSDPLQNDAVSSFSDLITGPSLNFPRAVFYISGNAVNFDPNLPHNPEAFGVDPSTMPVAEGLFVWDAGDGLQNGEYDAYVVMAEPLRGLETSTQLTGGATTTPGNNIGAALVRAANGDNPATLYVDCEFLTDRGARDVNWGTILPSPPFLGNGNIDVSDNGITDADSFGLVAGLAPSSDGIVYYGVVKIENNRLALRLRNWAEAGRLNRFTRVVLSPRHRTPGRMNINTAERQIVDSTSGRYTINPMIGLPGLLFTVAANGTVSPILPAQAIGPADLNNLMTRAQWIVATRPDYHDGRYFVRPSDLVAFEDPLFAVPVPTSNSLVINPQTLLEDTNPIVRYNRTISRFSRLANMITTRSDTFEIIVTAEVGTVSNEDINKDGRINYRGDFLTEGSKKVRVIYER